LKDEGIEGEIDSVRRDIARLDRLSKPKRKAKIAFMRHAISTWTAISPAQRQQLLEQLAAKAKRPVSEDPAN
jgi:hypothetical protein